MYDSIVISSGHGKYVRGASGVLDEVDEARMVVEEVTKRLIARGVMVTKYHDDVSHSQNENLNRIVDYHNSCMRDLDVSVHFNAYVETTKPMGTEVLYLTKADLAAEVSSKLASAGGFINRGAKKRTDLFFLNGTECPAILIETCFVDSVADAEHYAQSFDDICEAIASALGGEGEEIEPDTGGFNAKGKCSYFGGPDDMGVSADEGLAFISEVGQAPHLFLPYQPDGTTGLARRLNPYIHYIACRWNYNETPRDVLREGLALVRANGIELTAFPADWGPNEATGRVADLSPGLLTDLQLDTDDEVEVIFPYGKDT